MKVSFSLRSRIYLIFADLRSAATCAAVFVNYKKKTFNCNEKRSHCSGDGVNNGIKVGQMGCIEVIELTVVWNSLWQHSLKSLRLFESVTVGVFILSLEKSNSIPKNPGIRINLHDTFWTGLSYRLICFSTSFVNVSRAHLEGRIL